MGEMMSTRYDGSVFNLVILMALHVVSTSMKVKEFASKYSISYLVKYVPPCCKFVLLGP